MVEGLTDRQRQTLQFVAETVAERGYPPSVRETCEALGLASSSTVHSHLQALQRKGYIRIDPTKPRAIELLFDPETGLAAEKRPARSVPLLGRIAAGTPILAEEHVDEIYPMPSDLVGDRQQPTAHSGEIVAALIPSDFGDPEATVKTIRHRGSAVVFEPANPRLKPFEAPAGTEILGKVVAVLRKL